MRPAGLPLGMLNEIEEEVTTKHTIVNKEKFEKNRSPFTEFIKKIASNKQPSTSFQSTNNPNKVHIGFIANRLMERPLPPFSNIRGEADAADSTSNLVFLQKFSLDDLKVFSVEDPGKFHK